MNVTIQEWLKRAEGDFRAASREVEAQDEYSYPVICVLCQQCIEKTLKAFLILHRVEFPKIHDLEKLGQMVQQIDPQLQLVDKGLDWLTVASGTSRYPEGDISCEDAMKAYGICETVRWLLLPAFSVPSEKSIE